MLLVSILFESWVRTTRRNPCAPFTLPTFCFTFRIDLDTGRLERRFVQRDAEDLPLGSSLLRRSHDLRKLCPLQPAGRHSRRGLLLGGRPVFLFTLLLLLSHPIFYPRRMFRVIFTPSRPKIAKSKQTLPRNSREIRMVEEDRLSVLSCLIRASISRISFHFLFQLHHSPSVEISTRTAFSS